MSRLHFIRKITSYIACLALSAGAVAFYPAPSSETPVAAKTVSQIEEEREANNAKIAELQTQIDSLEGSKADEQAYQATLYEQITLIQSNIDLLNTELETIQQEIDAAEANIAQLDQDIIDQQAQIDANVELFKQRVYDMYVTGNENLSAVLLGSTSFYDMMAKVEMVNRIAAYDETLINDILADIESIEKSKSDLQQEKVTYDAKVIDLEARKSDKAATLATYNEAMQNTQDEIDRLAREQEMLQQDVDALEADNAELAAEQAEIEAEAQRAAAAAEAARLAAEEAARQQAASQNNTGSATVPSDPVYIPSVTNVDGFAWPAPGFSYISSYYGYRWGTLHGGIDIGDAGIHGGACTASKSGTVTRLNTNCTHDWPKTSSCGCGGGYGNYVMISHDDGTATLYGHLSSVAVSYGSYVSQGQVIGYIGSTGWSTGDHLHFEIYVGGVRVDPLGYVSP
ncbi:MAG: peptidoglycan DD-metalloendopeptidase family protein [Ruminococcus sp.]|nr:peptidoglycan DD-metalloendopeptidase family protein [Ruminococcus sp.]